MTIYAETANSFAIPTTFKKLYTRLLDTKQMRLGLMCFVYILRPHSKLSWSVQMGKQSVVSASI